MRKIKNDTETLVLAGMCIFATFFFFNVVYKKEYPYV